MAHKTFQAPQRHISNKKSNPNLVPCAVLHAFTVKLKSKMNFLVIIYCFYFLLFPQIHYYSMAMVKIS